MDSLFPFTGKVLSSIRYVKPLSGKVPADDHPTVIHFSTVYCHRLFYPLHYVLQLSLSFQLSLYQEWCTIVLASIGCIYCFPQRVYR